MEFDGFEPLIDDDGPGLLIGDHPGDQPIWPIDICFAQTNPEWTPAGAWEFNRYSTLKPAEWRGKLHKVFPRMLDRRIMLARPDGTNVTLRIPYALIGKKLIDVDRTNEGLRTDRVAFVDPSWYGSRSIASPTTDNEIMSVRFLGGFALRRRYHWSVLLGEGHGPRARFVTDAAGMREIFRLRDIPPGEQRRAALLHWVRAHWRKKRDITANDRSWVRQHLRGIWSYQWNGLRCQIEPAELDLEEVMR
jgi:hypothetical protein